MTIAKPDFKKDQLAVVTGGAGFVGSHLCERLVREGYHVISLDNYFTGTPDNHVDGVVYRTGHTKDIAEHITETPDILFHLGEYARTEKSFEDVAQVWDLNKVGTFAVLEFCRRKQCKLLYAGSSTKFADQGDGRDQSPYAWSKATNTELVQNYGEWFGLDYVITYFYNVYGPRELSGSYGTVIRIFIEQYRRGEPFLVTPPGTQTRNYTHVYDIVDGIILAAEQGQGDGYGIGADESYSVIDLVNMFDWQYELLPDRPGNRQQGGVDNAQVKALGWRQQHQLTDWVNKVRQDIGAVKQDRQRVLVFTTTYFPDAGNAEKALYDLMKTLPNIQFDVVTTKFSQTAVTPEHELPNVTVHRVGRGAVTDKYLLPLLGAKLARRLKRDHHYAVQWALFASYGALAAVRSRVRGGERVPLLITLADQKVARIPWYARVLARLTLGAADQIHATDTQEASAALSLAKRTKLISSIGQGDGFAHQLRMAYQGFLDKQLKA